MHLVVTTEGIGRVDGDEVALVDLAHRDIGALLRACGSLDPAAEAAVRDVRSLGDVELRCPVSSPTSIWGVGLNYHSKAELTGRAVPVDPIIFCKPDSALAAPGADVVMPLHTSNEIDYEAEVAIIVGRRIHDVDAASAWAAVAAITTANDFTARDVHRATGDPGLAKGYAGFSPVGPSVIDARGLPREFDLTVRSWVNDELRQDGRTGDFIVAVPELLAHISRHTVLEPGDVVLTGTPAGTGQDRRQFLEPGDRVTVEVEGLLRLVNTVVAP